MVYTASGQPLYLPPHARKVPDHSSIYNIDQSIQDDGMQSLLSAIELDIGHGRDGSEYLSNPSLQSSFVDSPGHQELMADLLGTNFGNDESEDVLSTQFNDFSRAVTPFPADDQAALALSTDLDLHFNSCDRYKDPIMAEAQIPPRRQWPGLLARFKDNQVRQQHISSVIKEHMVDILDPDHKRPLHGRGLVTIKFAWPSVAQKSYGNEKRLLTPFPICSVDGPLHSVGGDEVKTHLTIIPSDGDMMVVPYTANFDPSQNSTFKTLHINNENIGRSKVVNFKYQLTQKGLYDPLDIPLIDLNSPDVILLSKPSKKTSRLKIQSSFIFMQSAVSLFTRINSQTARTKYLTLESEARLGVQSDSWLPFTILSYRNGQINNEIRMRPLLYGETIVLRDPQQRYTSDPLIVRRCEGKTIIDKSGGNVSQMQRIVLEKATKGVSADPAVVDESGPSMSNQRLFLSSKEAQQPRDVRNYKCIPLPFTSFETATIREGSDVLEMEDAGQWTIVGVMSQSFTFLDTLSDPGPGRDTSVVSELPSDSALQPPAVEEPSRKRKLGQLDAPDLEEDSEGRNKRDRAEDSEPSTDVTTPLAATDKSVDSPVEVLHDSATDAAIEVSVPLQPSPADTDLLRIQTPLTPFPTLLSSPVYLPSSNRLHLQVRDFWQLSSAMSHPDIYLGAKGPLTITALQQSTILPTDAALEVELPTRAEVGMDRAPLLFVREDGLVVPANCMVDVPQPAS
ncbi:protein of unknown function [Taphrina deformans PYCC 5710]|uniref:Uncharacterized protein n=1 Tax=Taphrina deformans (strain PYCC 5710 / ATCC 11124 / CBS 356.35 / IMI 108563 / JCM 9778 / NBRC 8474) TaxID=1097556 RepID=R4XE64_TAPDE|nr:protein of unknown function [Taphrina deformans PYCC 5710]|eukprot:CCG83957.1 protein of unknown function [Taphrina deformans PYCC 5710]